MDRNHPKPPATSSASHHEVANGRPTISAGERALAMWELQNLMSRHEYYHSAGMNLESVDALWVKADGMFASTATFGSPAWVMCSLPVIREAYGVQNNANRQKSLEELSKVDPSVEITPENLGSGHEWVMHTSTTPVIEIAGDGRTAKGIWYSPGVGLMTKIDQGKIGINGSWFFEKYAGDFVFEDGVWKIWHLQMAYDFVPGLPAQMVEQLLEKLGDLALHPEPGARMLQAGERADFELPPGFCAPLYSFPEFSPQRPGIIYPPFPERYYTFNETFSYCNVEQSSPF